MGGLDLSWLAGGLSAAATYALIGGKVHRRYAAGSGTTPDDAAPVGSKASEDSALRADAMRVE